MSKRVLISGAGIAGPALAYWLARAGYETTIVERATTLRTGGQAVDFRGPVHRAVLERMGLWDAIHERRTRTGELLLVDRWGATRATLPAAMMSGDVEILRGDLGALLYERTRDATTYRFGDRIVGLDDRGGSVAVAFAQAPAETFDLVVGADGLHSGVRGLAFAAEPAVLRHRGYRIASFRTPNLIARRQGAEVYSEPGRAVCLSAASPEEGRALFVQVGAALDPDERGVDAQKAALTETFAGMGWRVPSALDALRTADDLYVDGIATVHVPRYAKGRVVLLGDAAFGGTLGGQGTSLAMVGAYVLARALSMTTDHAAAFSSYETCVRPYATRCQRGAARAGAFFAPRTRVGIASRDRMYALLTSRLFAGLFERLVRSAASDFALPEGEGAWRG